LNQYLKFTITVFICIGTAGFRDGRWGALPGAPHWGRGGGDIARKGLAVGCALAQGGRATRRGAGRDKIFCTIGERRMRETSSMLENPD